MSFKERTRNYAKEVVGGRCQFIYYTEERGWQQCTAQATQIHHIKGEAETLLAGKDPERNTPLPLCENHHVRNTSSSEHTEDFGFHPDVGEAYKDYRSWKAREEHMKSITGRRATNYSTSPFAEVARDHQAKAKRGERYIAGTDDIDNYYEQRMKDKQHEHKLKTGQSPPKTAPHPKTDPSKKRHWSDIFSGKRSYPEDEE